MTDEKNIPAVFDQIGQVSDLLADAVMQVEKDFYYCGFEFHFSETAQNDLYLFRDELEQVMSRLVFGKISGLSVEQLLYRADVREEDVKAALLKEEGKDYSRVLAEKMIIRALQRVNYRKKYR